MNVYLGHTEGVRLWCLCTEDKFSPYCVSVGFSCDGLRPEAIRQDPTRKGSVVNVNPTNTRPQSDTPEIRKYKKRFNSEILCAALWGRYLTAVGWLGFILKHRVVLQRSTHCLIAVLGLLLTQLSVCWATGCMHVTAVVSAVAPWEEGAGPYHRKSKSGCLPSPHCL